MDLFAPQLTILGNQGIWVWTLDPGLLIGLVLWTIGYILLVGPVRRRQGWEPAVSWSRQAAFHLGTLVLFIALVSPIDYISDTYLLSAHMIQHLMLLLVAPPLWLIGMPSGWFDPLIPLGFINKFIRWVTSPVVAFLIFNGVFYTWHIPALYDLALNHENIHILEHLMFLSAAVIGWWPILGFLPKAAPRASYPLQMIYIFLMMVFSTSLGAVISLTKDPLYPFYVNTPVIAGSPLFQQTENGLRLWGLSVMNDQQAAGLIMWVPGNMIFFSAFMLVLYSWFSSESRKDQVNEISETDSDVEENPLMRSEANLAALNQRETTHTEKNDL